MIRRLLILAFTLTVVGNSLAAAAQVSDDDCGACCRPANNQPSASLSKECCYSECEDPGESQPISPTGVFALERIYKADAQAAVSLVAPFEGQSSTVLQSSARSVIQSTHIYLRTGSLLI